MFHYWPVGPYKDLADLVAIFERYRALAHTLIYVVYDKSRQNVAEDIDSGATDHTRLQTVFDKNGVDEDGRIPLSYPMAGTIGFLNAEPARFSVEIGHLMTFPAFQRTHVTSNAIGLLTLLCLFPEATATPPVLRALKGGVNGEWISPDREGNERDDIAHGLGLRRVQYQANVKNAGSIRAAERFGYKIEGIARWQRAVSLGSGKEGVERLGDAVDAMGGWHSTVMSLCFDDWNEQTIRSAMQRKK